MPIFEFDCTECEAQFERLVGVGAEQEKPACPKCGSNHINKRFSMFGVRSSGGSQTPSSGSGCASCSSSSCASCN